MYDKCLTSISLSQMVFCCIGLHSYDPQDERRLWQALSEGPQREFMKNVLTLFSNSDHADLEELVIGKVAV